MIHGYVKSETFAGTSLHPGLSSITKQIGLTHSSKFQWRGYRTSLLRHMIDRQDYAITAQSGYTIHVKISNLMKSGGEQLADVVRARVGGIALSIAGGANTLVDMMNNATDAISAVEIVKSLKPESKVNKPLVRPGRAETLKDHSLNDRIIVIVEANIGEKSGWTDLGLSSCTYGTIAHMVNDYKP